LLLSAPRPAGADAAAPTPQPYTPEPLRFRPVFDPETSEFIEVAIHERRNLKPGAFIPGPAVIVEDETSTVLTRLFDARIDGYGYIELTRRHR
jgi:N-methylhydantoinase A